MVNRSWMLALIPIILLFLRYKNKLGGEKYENFDTHYIAFAALLGSLIIWGFNTSMLLMFQILNWA